MVTTAAEVFTLEKGAQPAWVGLWPLPQADCTFSYQVMGSYCLKMEVIMKANLWMEKSLGKATSIGPGQVSIGQRWAADSAPSQSLWPHKVLCVNRELQAPVVRG